MFTQGWRDVTFLHWAVDPALVAPLLPAGDALRHADLWGAAVAFAAFCLISSSIYLINDARDVEADRAHPVKQHRPIAAGLVSVPTAVATAVVLAVVALGVSALAGWQLVAVIAVYYVVQLGYCFGWKHLPVIDIALVSSGFMLRAMAGGVAAGIDLSQWFLLVAAFGSLFMASGKRYAELQLAERTGKKIRRSLQGYTATYLRFVWSLSATVVIMAYGLWAFGINPRPGFTASPWATVSIVPFVVAILRYAVDVDGGNGGEPEEIVLHDRVLQVLGLAWVVILVVAVYVSPALA